MKAKREGLVSDYITDALLFLMEREDYHNISITDLCKKAGVTRMSFYRNFESKEDILRKWLKDVTEQFLKESGISYRDDTSRDYIITLFTHLKQYQRICSAIYKAGLSYLLKDEFDRVFLSIHREEYEDYKSYFHAGGIYNVFLLWLIKGCAESPEELADKLTGMLDK
ncbi:MAG: TetR/AcrR family transcriptional regulator [Oscillibacter sp.]|nr:TetR/AcrR family transcriptional regulator [Oscillospiraceae bacterium]MBR0280638.1 TetR/AcrR family transcriptional regulator [Oscillibacter sp.]